MTDWFCRIFYGVGMKKEMEQGGLQWSYGFLEGA